MAIGLNEETARAACRIKHNLAQARVDDLDHKAHDCARRVELARIASRIAHLFEHGYVEVSEGMYVFGGGEVNTVDLVDDVAQQVAIDHAVDDAAKDSGDYIAPVAPSGPLQVAQVGKESGTTCAIWPRGLFIVDKSNQLIARQHIVIVVGPIAPAVGGLDCRLEAFIRKSGFIFAYLLPIVQEFEEHDPGEHGQAVQVTIGSP